MWCLRMLRMQMRSFNRKSNRFHGETGFSLRRAVLMLLAGVLFSAMPLSVAASPWQSQSGRDIVVVIDPGHGGDNEGTTENGFCEKEMTLTTALALYERLTQYEGVTVYLTRTDDVKSSLADRAEYAKSVGADILFSIHYNASEEHELFGSEVWVPLEAPYNAYGYQFGCTLLAQFQEKGLFIRGVKTRRGTKGDYYGILRESVERQIPAVLIEHCHVDEVRDYPYCDSKEKQEAFGYEDADAIARFLGLSSSSLGVDNSGEPQEPFLREVYAMATDRAVPSTLQDTTPPEICSIERISEDYTDSLQATVQVSAADYDSPLIYYAYSVDGGLTYSPRQVWPGSNTLTGEYQDVCQIVLDIPEGISPRIRIKAYNQFELTTESNVLEGYSVFQKPRREEPESLEVMGTAVDNASAIDQESESQSVAVGWLDGRRETGQEEDSGYRIRIQDFLLVSLLAALALLVLMMVLQIIRSAKRHRNRTRRGK